MECWLAIADIQANKLGLGGKLGNGNQYWSWITLEDEVRLIGWLLSADIQGPVNLTAPELVSNAQFTKALGSALGNAENSLSSA